MEGPDMNRSGGGETVGRGVAVALDGVGKTFPGGIMALQPTGLDIAAGEILVLLGPSGCGKTTLLRLVAGLEQPDRGGRIRFGSDDVTALAIEQRQVGMVFQSYALFPNMSVAGNVGYGLKVRGMRLAERQTEVARLLDMMGLADLAGRRIDHISGGQRQRVALARAIAIRPRVLLLDEPLAALDASLRERLRTEVAQLLRRFGITAVYVTHDQTEAMAIGDRVAVMDRGRIVQIGTPETIYRRPSHRFAAEFVGTMNRITGNVVGGVLRIGRSSLPVGGADRRTTVWFRPESLRLSEGGEAQIHGEVVGMTFFGASRRIELDIGTEVPVLFDAPSSVAPRPGEAMALALVPEALLELGGEEQP